MERTVSAPQFGELRSLAQTASYEEARAALDQCVAVLESGGLTLSDSVEAYEVGLLLAERCRTLLREAELRISVLDGEGEAGP